MSFLSRSVPSSTPDEELKVENKGETFSETFHLDMARGHGSEVELKQSPNSTSVGIGSSLGSSLLISAQRFPYASNTNNTRNNENIIQEKKSVDETQTVNNDSKLDHGNSSNTLPFASQSAQCSSSSAAGSEGEIPMDQNSSSNNTSSTTSESKIVGPLLSLPAHGGPLEPKESAKIDPTRANFNISEGSSRAENTGDTTAPTVPSVMTCSSLGSGDSKVTKRAETAVLKLYKLLSLTNHDTYNGTLILPTKDQIVKGLADIELQIKRLNQQRQQLVLKIEEQEQQIKYQREEEEERKKFEEKMKKEEQERIFNETKLQKSREHQKTKEETLRKLQQQLEELLTKKQQQFEQQREIQVAQLEEVWSPKVENKLKALRKAKHNVQKAKSSLATVRFDLSLLKDESNGDDAGEEEEAVKRDEEGEEEEDSVNMPKLLSSVMEENRKRAQQAHWNCISACLPLPHETTNGICALKPILMLREETNALEGILSTPHRNESSQVAIINDDGEEQESFKPVTNKQWTALTRRIMSPVDALYLNPTESLYWDYHEQRHNVLKDLILDQLRRKKRTLYHYWEALATDYIALQNKWKKRRTISANENTPYDAELGEPFIAQHNSHPGDDDRLHGESGSHNSQMPKSANKRNSISAANTATLQASFRRNRRPLRGANSSTTAFIRGLGDVVRSEYEQELIIKEITEKEAMEKRIKHGGCSLPRQVSALERELFVSYQVDFAPRKIADLKSEEQNLKNVNPWTDMEKCIFFDRFLLFPKDFKKIASFLRNKTTMDCVAFYYDAKKSLPFKGALREHLVRKRRGRMAENCNISWMATVQAAISAGASVSEGDGSDERPFTFSIPGGDNTYSTSKFHPIQRDILNMASEYSVAASCRSGGVIPSEKGSSLFSDNLKLAFCKASTVARAKSYHGSGDAVVVDDDDNIDIASKYDAAVGTKRQRSPEVRVSDSDSKVVRTSCAENLHEDNVLPEAESSGEVTQEPEQLHLLKSSTVVGAGNRKGAQKWTPEEKRIFFETLQQHGNDWPALVAAVGNKTLQQVKNFYYDSNKKQAIRNQYNRSNSRHSSDGLGSVRDASISPQEEVEETKVENSTGDQSDENFIQKCRPMEPTPKSSTIIGNDSQPKAGLNSQILREGQLGPAGIGTISGLHGTFNVERVGQNAHHDFLSNLNINPWAAAAQQLAIHQSRDPSLRMREVWALEASLRQHQQQFQQMAYTLGGQAPASHFPHDILGHIRASAGYTSPVPFVNTPPSEAQQAALMALTQMSVARNLAAAAHRMASRSGESSSSSRPPDQRASSASFTAPFQRDKEFGHESSSK